MLERRNYSTPVTPKHYVHFGNSGQKIGLAKKAALYSFVSSYEIGKLDNVDLSYLMLSSKPHGIFTGFWLENNLSVRLHFT